MQYNEVHVYPARGVNNLDGWDEVVEIDKDTNAYTTRTPETRKWDAFEFYGLHNIETVTEVYPPSFFAYLGTHVIYMNGETNDMKVHLDTGFRHKIIDQKDNGGKDLLIRKFSARRNL